MASLNGDATSLPASEATSWSHVSAGNPDQARIFVALTNGTRILVPVAQDATIQDLHRKALRRAIRFGFQWSQEDTFLETTTRIALDDEDKLQDILDLTTDNTFYLCSLSEASSSTMNVYTPPLDEAANQGLVFVRWITLEEAISQPRLSSIKADSVPISGNTPVSQFHKMAERVMASSPGTSARLTLFTRECRLSASNPLSLHQLNLTGTSLDPLDIFVDVDRSNSNFCLDSLTNGTEGDLYRLWGFPTTKRGICALTSTLKIWLKQSNWEELTVTLFNLTHFPPLLIALNDLHRADVDSRACASSLRMIAHAFHLLCLQSVPSWICPSPAMALESSRQVIVWAYSLDADTTSRVCPSAHNFMIREKKDQASIQGILPFSYDVDIHTATESGPNQTKGLFVTVPEEDASLANRLGQSIHDSFSTSWDYYLKFPENWCRVLYHKRIPTLQPTDFDFLLQTTALSEKFRMVGPPQLGQLLSNQLPVITLSASGLVSVYDQEYYECSEKRFFTWNAIDKKEVMKNLNPGQYLMQKLEPIIAERKKEHTWETDSWSDWKKAADFGTPDEAVVVCMDASGSMATAMPYGWITNDTTGVLPSRLTEVKEFFKNLALRVSALRLSTYLGLVTFSSKTQVEVKQELTPVHLNFEDQVEGIQALSSTAMYDGIDRAHRMLSELKKTYPQVKCRIVLLTDGGDNASTLQPHPIGQSLYNDDIVLDSIVIGTTFTANLFKISRMTGGYAFAPQTQQALFQIFLLETVVDIRTRPDIQKTPITTTWTEFTPKVADMPDSYTFPPCRPHPNQNDYFIALGDADRYLSRQTRQPGTDFMSVRSVSTRSTSTAITGTTLNSGGAGGHARVILSEIKEMINHPHEYMDVYVSESNMGFWKVAMQGPPASPYANGVFMLYIEIGETFPSTPPSARFMTPILHPNVTKHGRICHPIFDREWTGTTRIYQVLQHIWGIFMSLEARDAVDPLSTLKFWTDPTQGQQEVERYVTRFANRSRAAIRAELVGSATSSLASQTESWENDSTATPTSSTVNGQPTSTGQPPSYRVTASSPPHRRSSTISSYLASQRGPPPLMAMPGQSGAQASQPVSARGISAADSNTGPGRQLSRRASFFSMFKNR